MTKTIFALAAALFASNLVAAEEIYIYSSYENSKGKRISQKLDCRDSQCEIEKQSTKESITLSKAQRDQILTAFQAETKRFDLKGIPKQEKKLIKIKFRYQTDKTRLQISRRLSADELAEVSTEMTAVLESYFELDLSALASVEPVKNSEEKPVAETAPQK